MVNVNVKEDGSMIQAMNYVKPVIILGNKLFNLIILLCDFNIVLILQQIIIVVQHLMIKQLVFFVIAQKIECPLMASVNVKEDGLTIQLMNYAKHAIILGD